MNTQNWLDKLGHLNACPECGCTDVVGRGMNRGKQENAEWHERIAFKCGYKAHYSPYSKDIQAEEDCERSERAKSWAEQRTVIAKAMAEAAQRVAGKPDADLTLLMANLRVDLNNYRDCLEQVTRSVMVTTEEFRVVWETYVYATSPGAPIADGTPAFFDAMNYLLRERGLGDLDATLEVLTVEGGYRITWPEGAKP